MSKNGNRSRYTCGIDWSWSSNINDNSWNAYGINSKNKMLHHNLNKIEGLVLMYKPVISCSRTKLNIGNRWASNFCINTLFLRQTARMSTPNVSNR